MLRWFLFKQLKEEQGVDKLPPTQGAWIEHIRRAHVQANIWCQDMVLNPTYLDPLTLGWRIADKRLLTVLSRDPQAPASVLQLVRCNCEKSKCSRRCSCRVNNVVCTELCKCGGEGDSCTNITPPMIGADLEDDWRNDNYRCSTSNIDTWFIGVALSYHWKIIHLHVV